MSNTRVDERTDKQLLRDYSERRSEDAFAELVGRHVDAVYSAALRIVRDAHLAHDITQKTFVQLAQHARQLADRDVISGWLHTVTHNLAANTIRTEVRRRDREQQAADMNRLKQDYPDEAAALWEQISPEVDAALQELNEGDRDALTLRFFERKSAREISDLLNLSEEAAQKRVSRAIDRLRERLTQRGVTGPMATLAVALSANAVAAAPVGLTAALTTTTAFGLNAAATNTMVMTTLQKMAVATTIALSIGTSVHQLNRAAAAQQRLKSMQQQIGPLADQAQTLRNENARVAALAERLQTQNNQLQQQVAELPRLRAEVARLRASPGGNLAGGLDPGDPSVQNFLLMRGKAQTIAHFFEKMPDKKIPELALLSDVDWLAAVKDSTFDSEADIRKALSHLRSLSKNRLPMSQALNEYLNERSEVLPNNLAELKPYIEHALYPKTIPSETLDQILSRYELVGSGKVSDYARGTFFIVEKAAVDKEYDSRAKFGNGVSTTIATGIHQAGEEDYLRGD